jgi:hypothetical protein
VVPTHGRPGLPVERNRVDDHAGLPVVREVVVDPVHEGNEAVAEVERVGDVLERESVLAHALQVDVVGNSPDGKNQSIVRHRGSAFRVARCSHERRSEAQEAVHDAMCAPQAMPRIVEEET